MHIGDICPSFIYYMVYFSYNKVNISLQNKKTGFLMIITIDGPAAAGKGTLAKRLAEKYHLAYFDTGMVYRAVGLKLLIAGISPDDAEAAEKAARELSFIEMHKLSERPEFRSAAGGQAASKVAALPKVREILLKMQQDFAVSPKSPTGESMSGAVYDGRDTGTVVCPHADIKFFITASPEVRAMRRFREFQSKGMQTTFETVLEDMRIRDERDSKRATAPMKPADDAIIFDTSDLNIDEVFELLKNKYLRV